jgi:hypothetical protein
MSLSIGDKLTDEYKLVKDFKSQGKMKLYQKENSYMCTIIVPWFDPDEVLYIKIEADNKQLLERRTPPLAFSKDECSVFTDCLTTLADTINDGLEDEESHLRKMEIEYVSMIFWANRVMMFINRNRHKGIWNDMSDLLYSLVQIIYISFDLAQKQCISDENVLEGSLS